MKKLFLIFCLLCSFAPLTSTPLPQKAVVCVPVADLTVDPHYAVKRKGVSIEDYYQKIPFSGSWERCRRAHQLLFNEVVTIVEEKGAEARVKISNFYFTKDNSTKPRDTYWTLKKNLVLFEELKERNILNRNFPKQISYKSSSTQAKEKTITLKKPFYDPVTKNIYSVGTRFVASASQQMGGKHDHGAFEALILDPKTLKIRVSQIPKSVCVRNFSKKRSDKVHNYIRVLKLWADQKHGAIPYALGGWSWTERCDGKAYEFLKETDDNYAIYRKKWGKGAKSGLDCMGIIGRAAQICDIPFFIKNTTTLLKHLAPLTAKDTIEEGDILWYPGHVLVISSVNKGLFIEAAGYDRGVGKVQEVPIDCVIKEAGSFKQLRGRYLEKKPITILHSNGKPWKKVKTFKILKFKSLWDSSRPS